MSRPKHIEESQLLALHARLLHRDPTAGAVLVNLLIDALTDELMRHPKARGQRELVADAVDDALVSYIKQPEQFKSAKRGLWGYLVMAATGDLLNGIEKERRTRKKETQLADVELGPEGRNKVVASAGTKFDAQGPEYRAWIAELRAAANEQFSDPGEREVAKLMLSGISKLDAFVEALGIGSLPIDRQRAEVKRCKDKVTKRLQRLGERLRETR